VNTRALTVPINWLAVVKRIEDGLRRRELTMNLDTEAKIILARRALELSCVVNSKMGPRHEHSQQRFFPHYQDAPFGVNLLNLK
jgi:hypothetical protein